MQCLWQGFELIRFVLELGSCADLAGLLVREPHRQGTCIRHLSKLIVAVCPPACHNVRRSSCHVELPARFRAAYPNVFGVCKLLPLIHAG